MKFLISAFWISLYLLYAVNGAINPNLKLQNAHGAINAQEASSLDLSNVITKGQVSTLICGQCYKQGLTKSICLRAFCNAKGALLPSEEKVAIRIGDGFCAACRHLTRKPTLYEYCRGKFCLYNSMSVPPNIKISKTSSKKFAKVSPNFKLSEASSKKLAEVSPKFKISKTYSKKLA